MERVGELTALLRRAARGDSEALEGAARIAYDRLERIAGHHVQRIYGPRAADATIEPSALVSEAFLRLRDQSKDFENRDQFFAIASRVMLRALQDYERKRKAGKRGGDRLRITLSGLEVQGQPTLARAIDVAQALDALDDLDERKATIIRMRVLWGYTVPEIAGLLDVATATVERDWRFARVWLHTRLGSHPE